MNSYDIYYFTLLIKFNNIKIVVIFLSCYETNLFAVPNILSIF